MVDIGVACEFAEDLARRAGNEILMRHRRSMVEFTWDERTHAKTVADDESDVFIREQIGLSFPDDGIVSEETREKVMPSSRRWVVDPLDGTVVFASGSSNYFAVCIGICEGVTPMAGVIYAPERGELYRAVWGGGTTMNGAPIAAAPPGNLDHAFVALEYGKPPGRIRAAGIIERLLVRGVGTIFTANCASVSLALTASGVYHAFVAPFLEPWDMAAAAPICRGAGLAVTTLEGKKWELGDASIVAAHPAHHEQFLARIQ
ncbi:MAG: inositol monophosphatase [bacterium]|nr:inositol monophosphatase [bacterium]